jgi:predicted amidophosphoribosyltransferase
VVARLRFEKRVGAWLAGASDALVSVFFPAGCRLCECLLLPAGAVPICQECLGSFPALGGAVCERCGQPVAAWSLGGATDEHDAETLVCPECQTREYGFERARSYDLYKAGLVRAIMLLKFERMEPLGRWFAGRLAEVARREALTADIVVSVPLHRQRERERGYNQAELIAKPLAAQAQLAVPRGIASAHQTPSGQAHTQPGRALGLGTWRFCHASRHAS